MEQNFSATKIAPPSFEQKRDLMPIFIVGGIVSFVLILILIMGVGVHLLVSSLKRPTPVSPLPREEDVAITPVSSKFASDAAVLNLSDRLRELAEEIDAVDLVEPQLSPPSLDLNIEIK